MVRGGAPPAYIEMSQKRERLYLGTITTVAPTHRLGIVCQNRAIVWKSGMSTGGTNRRFVAENPRSGARLAYHLKKKVPAAKVGRKVSTTDVAPTLSDYLGVKTPSDRPFDQLIVHRDNDGFYLFQGLGDGNYLVQVSPPARDV